MKTIYKDGNDEIADTSKLVIVEEEPQAAVDEVSKMSNEPSTMDDQSSAEPVD